MTREIVEKGGETRERGVAHVLPGEGRTLRVMGELLTYKVTSDQTGGAYSLSEEAPDRREPRVRERPERFAWTRETAARYGIEIPPPEKQTQAKEAK